MSVFTTFYCLVDRWTEYFEWVSPRERDEDGDFVNTISLNQDAGLLLNKGKTRKKSSHRSLSFALSFLLVHIDSYSIVRI